MEVTLSLTDESVDTIVRNAMHEQIEHFHEEYQIITKKDQEYIDAFEKVLDFYSLEYYNS